MTDKQMLELVHGWAETNLRADWNEQAPTEECKAVYDKIDEYLKED